MLPWVCVELLADTGTGLAHLGWRGAKHRSRDLSVTALLRSLVGLKLQEQALKCLRRAAVAPRC